MNRSSDNSLDLSQLSVLAPELAQIFVALSADIALVIDDEGVIRSVEQTDGSPIAAATSNWIGRPWIDTVSGDTSNKVKRLLQDVIHDGVARRREVKHTPQPGINVPIAYTAIRLGVTGPVLAVGRDLRAVAAIQQRFIDSQRDMELRYWDSRQAELHARLLEYVETDAVLVVDATTLSILAANPASARLFATPPDQLIGQNASFGFARSSRAAVSELLATACSKGQSGEIRARLLGVFAGSTVFATSLRDDDGMFLLVRVRVAQVGIQHAVRHAIIVTDSAGRITMSNPAFIDLFSSTARLTLRADRSASGWETQPNRYNLSLSGYGATAWCAKPRAPRISWAEYCARYA